MELVTAIGTALGLGLLVGLQREWADKDIAGIRSFPLLTVLGAVAATLADRWGGSVFAVALAGVVVVLAVADVGRLARQRKIGGITTEVAALLMFAVGALVTLGQQVAALVLTGSLLVLLQWKKPLHALVDRLVEVDLRALAHLVLVALVIYPVLPDRTFGPYDVLNPRHIWRMVVLIVSISLAAYVARRVLGRRGGTVVGGVLGGLVSSTATTVSQARAARLEPATSPVRVAVILLASATVFGRLAVEVGLAAPTVLPALAPPLGVLLAVSALVAAVATWRADRAPVEPAPDRDPTDLGGALVFGLLYAGVVFVVAAVQDRFGAQGLYVVAVVSGLTDVDAITLSTANLVRDGHVDPSTAWRVIVLAALSNVGFKAGVASVLGGRALAWRALVGLGLTLATGAALLALWPG
ncbi:MAG: MgtC/SapB family protein [Alphaproteobacteria bacterium]|nr:MgtC/SapB family protein [Alphaproteobacteria bacterium]